MLKLDGTKGKHPLAENLKRRAVRNPMNAV